MLQNVSFYIKKGFVPNLSVTEANNYLTVTCRWFARQYKCILIMASVITNIQCFAIYNNCMTLTGENDGWCFYARQGHMDDRR